MQVLIETVHLKAVVEASRPWCRRAVWASWSSVSWSGCRWTCLRGESTWSSSRSRTRSPRTPSDRTDVPYQRWALVDSCRPGRNTFTDSRATVVWLHHSDVVGLKRSDVRRPPEGDVASRACFRRSPRSCVMPLFPCSIRADSLLGIGGLSLIICVMLSVVKLR